MKGSLNMLLADWRGTKVWIWNFDHNPPHVHVKHAEHKATVNIQTRELIDGVLPQNVYRRIYKWLERCQEQIIIRWDLASSGQAFSKISEDCEDEGVKQ